MRWLNLLVAITVLSFSSTVIAQNCDMTVDELMKLKNEAAAERKGLAFRFTSSSKGSIGDPGASSESVYEYGADGSYRYIMTKTSDGKTSKEEGIRVDSILYRRPEGGEWTQMDFGGSGPGPGLGGGGFLSGVRSGPNVKVSVECLGEEEIDGKDTNHFRLTRIFDYKDRKPPQTRRDVEDYWFDLEGKLVKESATEELSWTTGSKRESRYEYGVEVTITAPKVD